MILAWLLVTLASLLLFSYKFAWNQKTSTGRKKKSKFWIITKAVINFCFKVKSEDRLTEFQKVHKIFPRYTRMNIFNNDFIAVYDPDLLKKIFAAQTCCQRPFRNCIGLECGLLSSEYYYWKSSRKHLNLAFNLNVLKGFIPIFSSYADDVVKDMEENLDGKEFDLLFPLAQLTGRTVAATIVNVHGIDTKSYQKMIDSILLFLDILFKRMITPFWNYDWIFKWTKDYKLETGARKFVMDYGDELIATARNRRQAEPQEIDENGNVVKKDAKVNYIIDQLINHEEKFTDREIREHLFVLLITASETTANLVATAIVYLAIYPEIQQKVFDEISEVYSDESVEVDYDNIGSLKYLDMVIKEMLRLFSPVPISMRQTIEEVDIGLKKPLAKGATILIFNYVLHRRRDIWGDDSDEFNPDRFLPENVSKRDPYGFLPFGAGPRMCIGNRYAMLSAKIEILTLIKAFKFSTKLKKDEMKMTIAFTGKLSTKHMVSIEKRK